MFSRKSLVLLIPIASLLALAACGGRYAELAEDDAGTVVVSIDAGASKDGTAERNLFDAAARDASPSTDAASQSQGALAKLTLVNATTDLGPAAQLEGSAAFRLCFMQGINAQTISVAPFPPLPDRVDSGYSTPGIFHGRGGTLPSFGVDLEPRVFVPVLMNAKTLSTKGFVNPGNGSPGTTCDEMIGATKNAATGLIANVDYWEMPQLPAGTFKRAKSYVLVVTGGVGNGNVQLSVFEVTRTPIASLSLGVQFIHASAQASAFFGVPFMPGFVSSPATSSNFRSAVPSAVAYQTVTPLRAVAGVTDNDSFVLAETNPAAPPASLLPFSMPKIQALSGLGSQVAPTVYTAGKNFVFIALGDPALADTDPRSFHVIALPSDPAISPYVP
jgi:hypothetical protein